MALRLYDTRTRAVRAFEPLRPGHAGIYVCGPTVQSPPHVGHARSAIAFDILRRWLTASGYDVAFLRNVTDIDDKILHNGGHAYAADGDVYFDVRSFPAYGALSGQNPDQMLAAADDGSAKRDPLDFALWKGAKPNEP